MKRGLGVDDRRQFFDIPAHQLGRVFGLMAGFGDNDRDRLADVADLVVRQDRLPRAKEFMLDDRGPFAWRRDLALGHRGKHPQQIGPVERANHAGRANGTRQVDRANVTVRDRAAHQYHMQHAWQHEVGDELPLAGQQPVVFAP